MIAATISISRRAKPPTISSSAAAAATGSRSPRRARRTRLYSSSATAQFFAEDKPVELFIAQPRVNDGERFTRWVTSTKQLEAYGVELRDAVKTAMQPDAPLKMGKYCKFCSAKSGCPLYQNLATNAVAVPRDAMQEHLEEWLPQADMLIELGNFIKTLAHDQMENGMAIPGWKLVNKRAVRSWKDPDKTVKYFAKVGLPAADRYVKKLVSPAQAETALKQAGLPAVLPPQLVDSVSSGTTLAPESDKRPALAVAPNAFKLLSERLAYQLFDGPDVRRGQVRELLPGP